MKPDAFALDVGRPREAVDLFPLSFAQQRLWFLDRMAPGNPFYNIPLAIPVLSMLDIPALERAFNAIVQRHESLRTTFCVVDGEPRQVVHSAMRFELRVVDLRHEPPARRQTRTVELATEDARRPFDLERGPLLRCAVVTRSLVDHVLLLSLHHIVADGWSMGILARELTALYQAQLYKRPAMLPPLPIQYADFAVWQRQWLGGGVLERQLDHWSRLLADLPVLDLPCDRPRPPVLSYRGAYHPLAWPATLSRAVQGCARARQATPFMVLIAAFALLLRRYSGQEDVVIGTPMANRNRAEIEDLIGFFVNSLVLRIDLSGDPDFHTLLARVHEVALQAYAHQDLPFEKLVERFQPVRDPSRNPLFQVTLQLVNTPSLPSANAGGPASPAAMVQRGSAIFDLAVTLIESPGGYGGIIEYSTDLFDAATVQRLDHYLQRVLDWALTHPTTPLSALPLMDATERRQALAASSGAPLQVPLADPFVHRWIARQAQQTPDAVALRLGTQQTSYRELAAGAARVAKALRGAGVGPDNVVGLLMERSAALPIALLGVLQAGGAYLPLDPASPVQRLTFMLADADAVVVLTDRATGPLAQQVAGAPMPVLVVEDLPVTQPDDPSSDALSALPAPAPDGPSLSPNHLAYVLYTSGSTGMPKGVAISHRALANHMAWMQERFALRAEDRVLQRTLHTFDASVWELLAPPIAGACSVLLPPAAQKDPEAIAACMAEQAVSVAQFVPSLLEAVLDEPRFYTCDALRLIYSGGEALPDTVREKLTAALPVELVNLYGPTEVTIDATFHVCGRASEPLGVPIGQPVSNLCAYVLDEQLELVPPGVAGELVLGGAGLARGYVARPALTAERFVPDPHGSEPGARLYRTGDRVRRRADGALLYLGRMDQQIKLRGHRIELGEVEAAIADVPGVQRCAVVAQHTPGGDAVLVACVVPGADSIAAEPALADPGERDSDSDGSVHVSTWQGVYEEIYGRLDAADEAAEFIGWNSSYDGRPLPLPEMQGWLAATLARIRALHPRRVLEVGCGTGLLLRRLAPECEHYVGVDFSQPVLRWLADTLPTLPGGGRNVQLLQRRADELDGFAPGSFDTVALNSVVQYFPSLDHLATVLRRAAATLDDDGTIFVGDVRSLPLLDAFAMSVVLHKAWGDPDAQTLKQRARQSAEEDRELVVDPAFFYAIAAELGAEGGVQVHLKPGRDDNELTRFRYDVVLSRRKLHETAATHRIDWSRDRLEPGNIADLTRAGHHDRIVVEGVPNARVQVGAEGLAQASTWPGLSSTPDLEGTQGVQPEDVLQAVDPAYDARLSFSASRRGDCFDIVLVRRGARPPPDPAQRLAVEQALPWQRLANQPLKGVIQRRLSARIRQALQLRLPDHMLPSACVLLDELPLLTNGKLDRKALAKLSAPRGGEGRQASARNALERVLADVFAEVLAIPAVGVRDDFFADLGGHSLLATRLIARVRQTLLVDVALNRIFQSPTVEQFAAAMLHERADDAEDLMATAESVLALGHLSDADLDAALPPLSVLQP